MCRIRLNPHLWLLAGLALALLAGKTSAAAAAPPEPTALAQFKPDGVTAIAMGGYTMSPGADGVVLACDAIYTELPPGILAPIGPDTAYFEVVPVGTAFTGEATASVFYYASGTVSVPVTGLVDGKAYHWQAWVTSFYYGESAKVPFGGNPETDADFTCGTPPANQAPTISTTGQYDTGGAIPLGGTTATNAPAFKATATDPDGDAWCLEAEVRPVGTAFTNAATATSAYVASGSEATAVPPSALADGPYHWQYRARDSNGNVSAWAAFGGNGESEPDFTVSAGAGGGGGGSSKDKSRGCSSSATASSSVLALMLAAGLAAWAVRRT